MTFESHTRLHTARHRIVPQSATVCDSRRFSQWSPVTRATQHIVFLNPDCLCVLRMESDKRLLRICQLIVLLCFAASPVSADLKGLQHVNGEDVVSQVYDQIGQPSTLVSQLAHLSTPRAICEYRQQHSCFYSWRSCRCFRMTQHLRLRASCSQRTTCWPDSTSHVNKCRAVMVL